jgi:hypothetical protein
MLEIAKDKKYYMKLNEILRYRKLIFLKDEFKAGMLFQENCNNFRNKFLSNNGHNMFDWKKQTFVYFCLEMYQFY